ncbi:MAG: OB-fold domain-containing protein [Acidimicrobiia bacterium]|nr:OB-fold domain-containing protein [Acidimicrobiia bacterium]
MVEQQRFAPTPTPETQHFWDGCRLGELRLQRCEACGHIRFPPQAFCPRCGSEATEVVAASGRGRLASYVIANRPLPGWHAPYVIALVALDEGPRLLTNLVDCEPRAAALPVGMPVEVRFEERSDSVSVPVFAPVEPDAEPDAEPGAELDADQATPPFVVDDRPLPEVAPPRPRNRGAVAIVGAAETTELGTIPSLTPLGLHTDAARNALADAGLTAADIDGVACAGVSPLEVAFRLGITPTWVDGTAVGGCSFMLHVRHAVAAIEAGLATTVLITHGESGRSGVGGPPGRRRNELMEQFELPYGVAGPPTLFTLPALAWMHRYGITEEQLASVAVAQRAWASRQPRALRRDLLTVDEVLDSPMIAWPFRRHMCCLVTDGGGALVLRAAERASDHPAPPVYIWGTGEGIDAPMVSQMADLTSSRAFRVAGRRALAEAGISTDEVDHLMAYDAFAHTPCYALEALGFTGPGESAAFVAEGHTAPGGSLPMNTNGGGLSYTHTGMYGMFAIQESVRQLRGTSAAQVDGVDISVAHGVGGMFAASGTLVLGRSRP